MPYEEVMRGLKSLSNPDNLAGMARYGINTTNTYGISVNTLRRMARDAGRDHALALQLWSSGVHEARILATMVDEPSKVTEEQMESWVRDLDSWDVCDQVCGNLFDKTGFAYQKAHEWSQRGEEFVKRAAFALMAALAVHDKKATDTMFHQFLLLIKEQAEDGRNYVRKAVSWALRSIGKRNYALNGLAVATARELLETDSRSARWVASDALRELTSDRVQRRFTAP